MDVELFVSEEGDQFMVFHAQCSYYQALLEAGIRIYRYPAPAVLHSKYFSIDDDVAVIGSSNMDMRSFALNHEVSMMLTGGDIVARFREVEDTYRALSRELTSRSGGSASGSSGTSTTRCGSPPPCSSDESGGSAVGPAHGVGPHERRHHHDVEGDQHADQDPGELALGVHVSVPDGGHRDEREVERIGARRQAGELVGAGLADRKNVSDAAITSRISNMISPRRPRPASPRRTAPSSLAIIVPTSTTPPTVPRMLSATMSGASSVHSTGKA